MVTKQPVRLLLLGAAPLAGLLACAVLLGLMSAPVRSARAAPAATVHNWPGPCGASLQACILNADPGDTILIAPGVHTASVDLTRAVSLVGNPSGGPVVLQTVGAASRPVVVRGAAVDNSVVISGLTIIGGWHPGGSCPTGCGGAMLITDSARPMLHNLIIRNGYAGYRGGGLYAHSTSPLTLHNVSFISNTAGFFGGAAFVFTDTAIYGGRFERNACTQANCWGGALYADSAVVVDGTDFITNTSGQYGGAVLANMSSSFTGGLFSANACTAANCWGGALYANGPLLIEGTRFVSNTATLRGGAVVANNQPVIESAVLVGNRCSQNFCSGGGLYSTANLTYLNMTTLNGNSSDHDGGGLYAQNNVEIHGSLFINNECRDINCLGAGLAVAGGAFIQSTGSVNNSAGQAGGGAYLLGGGAVLYSNFDGNDCRGGTCLGGAIWAGDHLTATGNAFMHNQAGRGGGLYQAGGRVRAVNNVFAGNHATINQGAALALSTLDDVTLLYNTVASPTQGSGSAIYAAGGSVGITNTILANYDTGVLRTAGSVFQDFNLFSGLNTGLSGGGFSGGTNSLTGTTAFVNPAARNYRLTGASDAIDNGINVGVPFDAFFNPRPIGPGFDIGYHEFDPIRRLYLPLIMR
jgi:predicted outer membrane repeat protein